MKRSYVRIDLDKTEFDIMCNHLDMSLFETDQMYTIKFAFYDDGVNSWNEQPYKFNFKVRSDVY